MTEFKEIKAQQLSENPFKLIGQDWTLITTKKEDKVNAMTASWGGVGVLWGQNVVFVFIRDSRYTKEFIDATDHFSLAFFDGDKERKNLGYFGTVSGRDEDKIAKVGYEVAMDGDTPYIKDAKTVLLCKKLARVPINKEEMLDSEIYPKWYTGANQDDFHDMYVGAIEKILVK